MNEPLTITEEREEFAYRLKERLGIMTDGRAPTIAEETYARLETMQQMREVKKAYDGSVKRV